MIKSDLSGHYFYTLLVLLSLFLPASGKINQPEVLKVAIPLTEPFAFRDSTGNLAGFDIDLINFFRQNGLNMEMEHPTFLDALTGLSKGQYDFVCGGIYVTKERKKHFLFTRPYLQSGIILLSWDIPENYASLKGWKIGVKRGATGEIIAFQLREKFGCEVSSFESSDQEVRAFLKSKLDGMITDYYNALYLIKKYRITDVKFFPSTGFLEMNPIAVAVAGTNHHLHHLLDSLLAEYMDSQLFQISHFRWFGVSFEQALETRQERWDKRLGLLLVILLLAIALLSFLISHYAKELRIKRFKEKQILEIARVYTSLFKHVPQGIVIFSVMGKKKYVPIVFNEYMKKILESLAENLKRSRMDFLSLVELIEDSIPVDFYEEIIQNRQTFSKYFQFGSLHYNIMGLSLENDIYALIINDVTSEKFYRDALKESQEKYKFALMALAEGIIWVEKDRIREINPAAEKILGIEASRYVGKSIMDLIQPELWKTIRNPVDQRGIAHVEMNWISYGQKRILSVMVSRLEYRVVNYLILIRDITTERKHLEEINYLASFKAGILKAMPSAIFALNENGQILEINDNAAVYWEIQPEAIEGKVIWNEIPVLEVLKGHFDNVRNNQTEVILTRVPLHKDGRKIYFNVALYPVEVNNQRLIILKHDDVTREVQLDEQLKQAQKMELIGELAGSLVHDFNNILGALDGTLSVFDAEIAMNREITREKLMKRIQNMKLSVSRARELIQRLLVLGRRHESKREIIDLVDSLHESIDIIQDMLPKNIELHRRLPPFPVFMIGDSLNIQQIIINLIKNAADALHKSPGKIEIRLDIQIDVKRFPLVDPSKSWVWVAVSDNGPGIPEEIQEKIFEPFFTTKPKGKGTGLGLAIVYNLIREMGGLITVESSSETGTTFHILFPRIPQEQLKLYFTKEQEKQITGKGRVLVVDDDEIIRLISVSLLQMSGFETEDAEDGLAALEKIRNSATPFDAIVMDLIMPRMNGYDTFFEIKKIQPDIPVIIATAFKQDKLAQELLESGAFAVIQKPYTREEITVTLVKAIQQAKSS